MEQRKGTNHKIGRISMKTDRQQNLSLLFFVPGGGASGLRLISSVIL
jgi:hypothetical protein